MAFFVPPRSARLTGPVIYIQNGNPRQGRSKAKTPFSACSAIWVVNKTRAGLLDKAVVIIVPFCPTTSMATSRVLVGGNNRINQNGPEEMGLAGAVEQFEILKPRLCEEADAVETRQFLA